MELLKRAQWIYKEKGLKRGPVSFSELEDAWRNAGYDSKTIVSCENRPNEWKTIKKYPNLRRLLKDSVCNVNVYQKNHTKWSRFVSSFLRKAMNARKHTIRKGVVLSDFLRSVAHNTTIQRPDYAYILNNDVHEVFAMDNYHVQLSERINENGEFSHYELIIAGNSDGKKKKRMAVLTAESLDSELVEMDYSRMREGVIIDLNFGGRRWEGGELNGKQFGFGCEYSEDDNLVYEGFVFEGMKVCFGKEWNDDGNNNCLMYEGGYWNGKRWGKGKSYDLSGNVDFEGKWMNNHVMTENEKVLMNELIVPMSIEEFVIGKKMFSDENVTTLRFSYLLIHLKRIEIGNQCFQHVREFVIDYLESLEILKIGEECFRIGYEERDDGVCRITNCSNLRQLRIGGGSYRDFKSFELSNVNSLKSFDLGLECFKYAKELMLKG